MSLVLGAAVGAIGGFALSLLISFVRVMHRSVDDLGQPASHGVLGSPLTWAIVGGVIGLIAGMWWRNHQGD
jgi:hypothetical protein